MSLVDLPRRAGDYIESHGWAQGEEVDDAGHVCLTGALRLCESHPGDWYIARVVFRRRFRAEEWNDDDERTAAEVIGYLRSPEAAITDDELAKVFGPQWRAVVAMVRSITGATPDQVARLDATRDAAWAADRAAAWAAAWAANRGATRGATRGADRDAAWAAAWDAAWDAAWALVVRDLISENGFTQEHYDLLTGPWAAVFGPAHPDDVVDHP